MRKLVLALLILLSNPVLAYEEWHCGKYSASSVIVKAIQGDLKTSGSVEVFGDVHVSFVSLTGFEKRWDFGFDDGEYKYAFIIGPDGSARYYDFSLSKAGETVKASMFFTCKLVATKAE